MVPQLPTLLANVVKNFAKPFYLRRQVERVVTDKKPEVVGDVGVFHFTDAREVIVLYHVMAKKTAPGDDAISDIRLLQRRQYPRTMG